MRNQVSQASHQVTMDSLSLEEPSHYSIKHRSKTRWGGERSGQTCVGCDDESGEDLPLALVEHLREHGVREVKRERQPVHLEQAAGHVLVHLKAGPRFRQSLVNHFVEY